MADKCKSCRGSGECGHCSGRGKVSGFIGTSIKCARCNGSGVCPACRGTGKIS